MKSSEDLSVFVEELIKKNARPKHYRTRVTVAVVIGMWLGAGLAEASHLLF